MAEINFNNLYNQLKPMEKRFYDQQFQKSYDPNKENLRLSSQPAYEQMKAVYDAQQQVPEESFLDKINIFGSASAAEMPQVPNLTYRDITPTFNLGTGITNTTAALPFKTNVSEILNRYNVPNSGSQNLVNQLIAENQKKTNPFDPRNIQSIFPTNFPSNIRQDVPLQNLGIDTSYGVANEEDVEQEFLPDQESSGIAKLFEFLGNIPTPFNLVRRGLESLRGSESLSDFRNSRTGAEFFKRRRDREALARNPNVFRDARNITKSLASRPSSTSGGYQQGPGGSGAQTTSAKSKTSSPTNVGNPFGYR